MIKWKERETMLWQRATRREKEQLLDTGLADRIEYMSLVRELRRKYAI